MIAIYVFHSLVVQAAFVVSSGDTFSMLPLVWMFVYVRYMYQYNIMCLSGNFHIPFARGHWLLIPEMDIIDRYFKSIDPADAISTRRAFPSIPNGVFQYKMIPVADHLANVAVLRQINITPCDKFEVPKAEDFKIYLYPFDEITMQSHVHPRYAIFEAGRKLFHCIPKTDLQSFSDAYPDLYRKLWDIFISWTQPIPPDSEDDAQFRPPTPQPTESSSLRSESSRTPPRRIVRFVHPPYNRQAPWDAEQLFGVANSPSPSSPSVRPSHTMDWAFENDPRGNPSYWNDDESDSCGEDDVATDEDSRTGSVAAASISPPRTRKAQGGPDSSAEVRLSRESLKQFDEERESGVRWNRGTMENWARSIEPMSYVNPEMD